MKVKVLGINGSARPDGWTYSLLAEVLKWSEKAGAETKLLNLSMLHIDYCTGSYSEFPELCNLEACIKGKVGDAFGNIVWDLLEADAVIFASPVYWYSPSALIKVLLERMTSLENMGAFMMRGKVGGVVVVGEEGGAINVASSLLTTLTHMGFVIPPMGAVYLLRRWDDERKAEAYEDARTLGVNVVKMAELIQSVEWDWVEGWREV